MDTEAMIGFHHQGGTLDQAISEHPSLIEMEQQQLGITEAIHAHIHDANASSSSF